MQINVFVTTGELEEMKVTKDELKRSIISDLDNGDIDGEYVGFNVDVCVIDGE